MMKPYMDYQQLNKGASRPTDNGEIVNIEASDKSGAVVLPNVGDYVYTDNSADKGKRATVRGIVRSRLFRYIRINDTDVNCAVNIVVEDADVDWGALVKE